MFVSYSVDPFLTLGTSYWEQIVLFYHTSVASEKRTWILNERKSGKNKLYMLVSENVSENVKEIEMGCGKKSVQERLLACVLLSKC